MLPLVIAHRGVPGERLEHTRPSYLLAIEQGADFIEPDVVSTSDGILVVRHENEIDGTTDVADRPEFADRKATKIVDGVSHTGWFTEDFTLAELKTLRCKERIPDLRPGNVALAGTEEILTLDEVLDIAETAGGEAPVGVYIETKHPSYFESIGISLNDMLIETLERRGFNDEDSTVVIQSFESANLRALRPRTPAMLVQLMSVEGQPADFTVAGDARTYDNLRSDEGLAFVAEYADAIGPFKELVVKPGAGPTGLVERAHAAGLDVHVWTMRNENAFLPPAMRVGTEKLAHGDAVSELLQFFDAGIDGAFSDFTSTAVQARSQWLQSQ
ncbi:glycerophosphodiester phosphodiesterase [Aeromicrobium panaciterrae]|uniref:glycerophosphodiester phosphodiesterase n=1 Tax=Aeromicrobium panaciterrae TaxID=363861 RepID=UPI0031DDC560